LTQEDIDKAKVSASNHCAIARAIANGIAGSSHILVDIASIRFTHDGGAKRSYYMTPANVQQFIILFDKGDKVEPIEFTLREGTTHDVARRPGVGGRPRGTRISSPSGLPKVQNRGRRTYGARSMTALAVKRAKSHA
jgi:hypothetical protein